MAEENGKKAPEMVYHAPTVEFDNTVDYVTDIGFGRPTSPAHRTWAEKFADGDIDQHPERLNKYQIVIRMPDPKALLETPEAKAYSAELEAQWGISLADGLQSYIGGKLSTMPAYMSALPDDPEKEDFRLIGEEGHQQMQKLADEYKVGTRATGGSTVKAKAQQFDQQQAMLKEAGLDSIDDAVAKLKEHGLL